MEITNSGQGDSALKRASDAAQAAEAAAPGPPAPEPAAATTPPRPGEITPGTLGVVFVHGIGSQLRGETLLQWSGPIVRAVSGWARNTQGVIPADEADAVVRSEIDFAGGSMPYVTVRVPAVGASPGHGALEPQTWVMTEAWWAQRVSPPPLGTMIDWCGPQGAVARIVERIIAHLGGGGSSSIGERIITALSKIGFGLFVSTACTLLLLLYAVARALAAIVPIPAIQQALTRIQLDTLLTKWWGEVYLLLDDPIQSANIRGRLNQMITALREFGCERIAVIAHSGGTIVSYMALSDPAYDTRADTLITHGEAIGMGRFIGADPRISGQTLRLGGGPTEPGRWTDFWATHDPAPCGQLPPEFTGSDEAVVDTPEWPGNEHRRAVRVWNRRSVLDDHGTYWDNDEEFVYPVLAELEAAGRRAASSRFRPSTLPGGDSWVRRRWQRVAMLTLWVRTLFVVPLLAAVGAFALGDVGMVERLRDLVYGVVGAVPGVADLANGAVAFRLASPAHEIVDAVGLLAIGILVLAALVHAALPIGQSEVWPRGSWVRYAVWVLDSAPAILVGAIVLMGVLAFGGWFRGHGFDRRLPFLVVGTVVALGLIVAVVAWPRSRAVVALHARAEQSPASAAAGLLFVVVALLLSIAYALIVDEGIRSWVAGALTAFVLFQALGAVGKWRWRVWDEREREAFRARVAEPPGRGWPFVQISLLGASALLGGATILLDWALGVTATVVVVAVLVVVSALRDAALRATPVQKEPARVPVP